MRILTRIIVSLLGLQVAEVRTKNVARRNMMAFGTLIATCVNLDAVRTTFARLVEAQEEIKL